MSLTYVTDLSSAVWLRDRLHPFGRDVGSVVPSDFEAYARIFHPAYRHARAVTWREIATANGRIVHAEMQFANIAGTRNRRSPQPHLWTTPPHEGSLPAEAAEALVGLLRQHTQTPEHCWFAIWEGWGSLTQPKDVPRLEMPHRGYYLAEGPIDEALRTVTGSNWGYQSASMWWPEDRSWFVSTEVDFAWTYVGGTRACIASILEEEGIESLPATTSDRFTYDSDTLNPPDLTSV